MPGRNGESYYTGTGFPRVFYLGYHLYKQYFPLLALTTYERGGYAKPGRVSRSITNF